MKVVPNAYSYRVAGQRQVLSTPTLKPLPTPLLHTHQKLFLINSNAIIGKKKVTTTTNNDHYPMIVLYNTKYVEFNFFICKYFMKYIQLYLKRH